jgi:hypothetical protein
MNGTFGIRVVSNFGTFRFFSIHLLNVDTKRHLRISDKELQYSV